MRTPDEDDGPGADYRRQAAELGWFSMLVPESLGGGSVSGNGVLDAALIAYERGRPAAARLVRRHQRRRLRAGQRRQRRAARRCSRRCWPASVGVVGAGASAATVGSTAAWRPAVARRRPRADGVRAAVQDVDAVVVAARHRVRRSRPDAGPRGRRHAGRHGPRARLARPHPAVRRGPLRRRRLPCLPALVGPAGRGRRAASTGQLAVACTLIAAEMVGRDGPRLRR